MELNKERMGKAVVVHVQGEVDASNVEEFKQFLNGLMREEDKLFVVDMSALSFIDSSGIGALVGFFKRVRLGEGDVRLAALPDRIRKIFELTRLDRVFTIYENVKEAAEA